MRATKLAYDVEMQLKKDLHAAEARIEQILLGGKPNHLVMVPHYLTPKLDETREMPKTDDQGAYHHYRMVRNVLEYVFEHDGAIKEKYRDILLKIQAPEYLMALVEQKV